MSFLDQNPFQSFAKKEPNPIAPEAVTKEQQNTAQGIIPSAVDEYAYKPLAEIAQTGARRLGMAWDMTKIAAHGIQNLFSDDYYNMQENQTKYLDEMFDEKEKERKAEEEKQIKLTSKKTEVQSKIIGGLRSDFQTKNPNTRVQLTNLADESSSTVADMYSTLDSLKGVKPSISKEYVSTFEFGTRHKSYQDYVNEMDTSILPMKQELIKRQAKYMAEGKGSIYAYNKMMEEPGSEEMANKINEFSNDIQADSNTVAVSNFSDKGEVYNTLQAAGGKFFDTIRYGYRSTGIFGDKGVSDQKFTIGGAAEDSNEIVKTGYAAIKNLYNMFTGLPTGLSVASSFGLGIGVEGTVARTPAAIKALANSSKITDTTATLLNTVGTTMQNSPKAMSFIENTMGDVFAYDAGFQSVMGRGMNEEDIETNLMLNLPINLSISLMARNTKLAQHLADQFDIAKTMGTDGSINLTKAELAFLKTGDQDFALASILNRNKVGANLQEGLINSAKYSPKSAMGKKINKAQQELTGLMERVKNKQELTNDTFLLRAAEPDNLLTSNRQKNLENYVTFKAQQKANKELESTMSINVDGENSNKFWSTKLTDAGKDGIIDIDKEITDYVRKNPESAVAAQMYRQVSGIKPAADFKIDANSADIPAIKRQYGKMIKDIYRENIAGAGKLVEGERLSPVHVFSQGQVKNLETGETQDVSKFFGSVTPSTYQKKAIKTTVLDDVAHNPEVFEYFTKLLKGQTQTDRLLGIFDKKSFKTLSSEEVILIRAALSNEILLDLASRGKKTTVQAMSSHPAYRIFTKNEDGTYSIALKNLDAEDLAETLGKMFKSMDEMSIVKYLADIKAQDEIITGLKEKGVKTTVAEVTANQPDYLKNIWNGFSEMLLRKTTPQLNTNLTLPKVPKVEGMRMMMQLQKAFPNIPIVYGKLPEGVKGIVSPYQGKLIIDDSKMTEFTSLHEYGHVWIMHAKADEKELYDAMSKAVISSPYFAKVKSEYATLYKNEQEFIDEAIAHAIEDSGARFLNKLERKNFMDRFMALIQSIFAKLRKTDITRMTDEVVNKLFNTKGKPVSEKTLAELDILQFSKEDFDKNSYFIRHIMQKISEDELFTRFAKTAKTAGEQEFIYQIINSMIKNTVPSKQLKSTVENYIHGFNDYIGLVNKDQFTEQYIKSEIAKLETSSILKSIIEKADAEVITTEMKNQSSLDRLIKDGGAKTDQKNIINKLDEVVIQMAKNLGLKRLFKSGSISQKKFFSEIQNTVDTIKSSEMSIVQKQKALIEQSIAYSNSFMVSVYEKVIKGEKADFSVKINGKNVSIHPAVLYNMLQVMRLPEFAGSKLTMKQFLDNKNVKANLKKYTNITEGVLTRISLDGAEKRRLISQIPVEDIPVAKNTIIITSEEKNPAITYAEFTDENGKYMTINQFLKEDMREDTNYLISANFFIRNANNPEMEAYLDKVANNKNVYPVAFSVIQSNGKNSVEINGFEQLKKYIAIKDSIYKLPEFKFEYSPSERALSHLSENSANSDTREELVKIINNEYVENPNAGALLTDIGVNPVIDPTVNKRALVHSLSEFGKIGEIYRKIIRGLQGEETEIDLITSDRFIITDNIKNEYLDSISGNEDLSAIYLNGKTLEETLNDEFIAVDSNDYLRNTVEDLETLKELNIDDTDFLTISEFNSYKENGIRVLEATIDDIKASIETTKGQSLGDIIKETKYATGKEAFNSIVKTLIDAEYGYTKISSIIKTVLSENPGWKNDILDSDAAQFLPSFDSFLVTRITQPIIEKMEIDPKKLKELVGGSYEKIHTATFKDHYPKNDTILHMLLRVLQKYDVLDKSDDVFAIARNIPFDQKQKLHILINNLYQGNIQKVVLDEETEKYAITSFTKLYRHFSEGMKNINAGDGQYSKEDISNNLNTGEVNSTDDLRKTFEGSEGEDGKFTTDVSVTLFRGSEYQNAMTDFTKQLIDFHTFERDSMLPEAFSFVPTQGKPLFESSFNLNVWASQPQHKVTTKKSKEGKIEKVREESKVPGETPPAVGTPVLEATVKSLQDASTRLKMYNIFNGRSVDTINQYAEYDAFDIFESRTFKSVEELENELVARNTKIQTTAVDITEKDLEIALNKPTDQLNKDRINDINKFISEYKGDNLGIILREQMREDYAFLAEYYASDAVRHIDRKSEVVGRIIGRIQSDEKLGKNAMDPEINDKLFNKILSNIIQSMESYRLNKLSEGGTPISRKPIFTMITEGGAKRSYYMNTLQNSPIFRMLIGSDTAKSQNPMMQLLDYGKNIEKQLLNYDKSFPAMTESQMKEMTKDLKTPDGTPINWTELRPLSKGGPDLNLMGNLGKSAEINLGMRVQQKKKIAKENGEKYYPTKEESRQVARAYQIIGYNRLLSIARNINKIQNIYAKTLGMTPDEWYQYTNKHGEVIINSKYKGGDDNINVAKEYIGQRLTKDHEMNISIDEITELTPIRVEGEGFDITYSKGSMTKVDYLNDYEGINLNYLDSHDFKFLYTDLDYNSKTFGQQFEAVIKTTDEAVEASKTTVTYITKKEKDELVKKLKIAETDKRLEIASKMKEAKEYGDLSENAEWQEAIKEYTENETNIQEFKDTITNGKIIDEIKTKITVIESGKKKILHVATKGDVLKGVVSVNSPIVKAIMEGKKEINDVKIISHNIDTKSFSKADTAKDTHNKNGYTLSITGQTEKALEIPKKLNKIDKEFLETVETATCNITYNLS